MLLHRTFVTSLYLAVFVITVYLMKVAGEGDIAVAIETAMLLAAVSLNLMIAPIKKGA